MSVSNRGQPLLSEKGKEKRRIAEEVGGTAAECAAICCCCPCGLVNLVILALYKVPAGLCKKAWKRRRLLKMKKKAFLLHNNSESSMMNGHGVDFGPSKLGLVAEVKKLSLDDQYDRHNRLMMNGGDEKKRDGGDGTEAVDWEKEMWDRFGSGGFWRSPSQRDTSS
ncbi:hypothetical protein ACB098_08G092700 [Castanea mollissima]|uniref:Pollen preferential protein n=1 Tax=Castanea mollissima TaxID=60419 RepID=A0A8J4QCN9_9ROSI|nr:hypothetical protein CMV_030349 [Castanea mollissima]KAF3959727.1 hypothetical protein CMV_015488 [Castanea mollissima]